MQQLNRAVAASLKRAPIAAPLTALGAQVIGDSAEQFAAMIASERALWGSVVTATGIRLER